VTAPTAERISKDLQAAVTEPEVAITPNDNIVRRLVLSWGIEPHLATEPSNVDIMFQEAAKLASRIGIVKKGELIVITAGIPMGVPGSTNVVKVHHVE